MYPIGQGHFSKKNIHLKLYISIHDIFLGFQMPMELYNLHFLGLRIEPFTYKVNLAYNFGHSSPSIRIILKLSLVLSQRKYYQTS